MDGFPAPVEDGARQSQQDQDGAGGDEQGAHALLDVPQAQVGEEGDVQQPEPAGDEQPRLK
ncbi:hypothetical protein GCM10010521_09490 [Streptomyces rameus]|uniref:Uncharacterized protein n=1 Tax=Streptomyces rameus TaxID=68261 RepID=A0ABP6MSY7_9ACTN